MVEESAVCISVANFSLSLGSLNNQSRRLFGKNTRFCYRRTCSEISSVSAQGRRSSRCDRISFSLLFQTRFSKRYTQIGEKILISMVYLPGGGCS